jgi:DNA-binding CsgD family transcriptional regulator
MRTDFWDPQDRLRDADVRAALGFVGAAEAAAFVDRAQLEGLLVTDLRRVLPSDMAGITSTWWWSRGPNGGPHERLIHSEPAVAAFRRREPELWQLLGAQHPTVQYWERSGQVCELAAVRFSDIIGRRAYQRLPAYHHVLRPLGIEYELGVSLCLASGSVNLAFTRARRDFSERERELLETLRPYLASLLERAETGRARAALSSAFDLTPREADVLALPVQGKSNAMIARMLFIAPGTVRKHLERVYAKLGVANRTEAAGRAFEVAGPAPGDRPAVPAPDRLTQLGLTPRELEVLRWVAPGKTNAEIALLLYISPETVRRHMRNVFSKLGVRTRTAAVARTFQLLAQSS